MKIIITSILILLITVAQAQENSDSVNTLKNNELKLNVGYLLGLGIFEAGYERIINEESTVGLSLGYATGLSLNHEIDKRIHYEFSIVPYYRFFFGKKRAAGFFMEANGAFYSEESNEENNRIHEFGLGAGLSIGAKFVTKCNWVFEIYAGGGRNFINKDKITNAYARVGLIIGKRF